MIRMHFVIDTQMGLILALLGIIAATVISLSIPVQAYGVYCRDPDLFVAYSRLRKCSLDRADVPMVADIFLVATMAFGLICWWGLINGLGNIRIEKLVYLNERSNESVRFDQDISHKPWIEKLLDSIYNMEGPIHMIPI